MQRDKVQRLEGCVVLSKADEEQYAKEIGLQTRCIYNPVHIVGGYEDATNKKQVSEQQIGAKKTNEQGIKRILFVGRLVKEQKGLDYLVEIIKGCSAFNYCFEIVGDGADRPYLEDQIHQSGLERKVRFYGSTKNIQDYYINADLLVSTSRWEGFGLTLVEAMQFGIPCVAFDNSGPREILGDSGAGIIVSFVGAALTTAISELFVLVFCVLKTKNLADYLDVAAVRKSLMHALIGSICIAIVAYGLKLVLTPGMYRIAIIIPACILVYLLILAIFRENILFDVLKKLKTTEKE